MTHAIKYQQVVCERLLKGEGFAFPGVPQMESTLCALINLGIAELNESGNNVTLKSATKAQQWLNSFE